MDVTARLTSALDNLDAHAVKTRLCPDTQTMQFDRRGVPEWLCEHLEGYREQYTEALRFQAGLCIRCGDDTARHPAKNPRVPMLFCGSCYDRGAWENWALGLPLRGGPKGAGSKSKGAPDDGMFDGIGDDESEDLESLFAGEPGSP